MEPDNIYLVCTSIFLCFKVLDGQKQVNFFDKVIQIFSSLIFQNDLLIQEGMAQEEEKTKKLQEVIKICHSVKLSRGGHISMQ